MLVSHDTSFISYLLGVGNCSGEIVDSSVGVRILEDDPRNILLGKVYITHVVGHLHLHSPGLGSSLNTGNRLWVQLVRDQEPA